MVYFANGTEGEILDVQCSDCILGPDDRECPVLLVQLLYNYEQCDNKKLAEAMNCLINEKGVCQVREQLGSVRVKEYCDGCEMSFGLVTRHSGNLCEDCFKKET